MGSLSFAIALTRTLATARFQNGIAAGHGLFRSLERRGSQGIAPTLSVRDVFPMTHHVECVALLTKPSLTCRDANRGVGADVEDPALGRISGAL